MNFLKPFIILFQNHPFVKKSESEDVDFAGWVSNYGFGSVYTWQLHAASPFTHEPVIKRDNIEYFFHSLIRQFCSIHLYIFVHQPLWNEKYIFFWRKTKQKNSVDYLNILFTSQFKDTNLLGFLPLSFLKIFIALCCKYIKNEMAYLRWISLGLISLSPSRRYIWNALFRREIPINRFREDASFADKP